MKSINDDDDDEKDIILQRCSIERDISSDSSLLYQNGPGIIQSNLSKMLTTKSKLSSEGELSIDSPSKFN